MLYVKNRVHLYVHIIISFYYLLALLATFVLDDGFFVCAYGMVCRLSFRKNFALLFLLLFFNLILTLWSRILTLYGSKKSVKNPSSGNVIYNFLLRFIFTSCYFSRICECFYELEKIIILMRSWVSKVWVWS